MDTTKVIGYVSSNKEGNLLATDSGDLLIFGNKESFSMCKNAYENIFSTLKKIRCKDIMKFLNQGTPCGFDQLAYRRVYEYFLKDSGIEDIKAPEDAFYTEDNVTGTSVVTLEFRA